MYNKWRLVHDIPLLFTQTRSTPSSSVWVTGVLLKSAVMLPYPEGWTRSRGRRGVIRKRIQIHFVPFLLNHG